jgi:hypothetical protein
LRYMYVSMYSYVCFRGKYIVRAVLPIALKQDIFTVMSISQ